MTTQTLSLTYTGPSPLQDTYWIRIEQESADETATTADAASLIDALYDIDPCDDSEAETEESTSLSLANASPSSTMAEAVEETLDLSYCGAEADGSVEVDIILIRSHLDEPYTLRLNGGSVVETVQVNSSVTVTEEITEELTLPYPVVAGFTCTPAPLKRNGNTLRFASSQVGHMLVATYQTKWDLVTVRVDGIDGEPGECTALAFHHGVVAEHSLDVPNAAEADTALCPSISWQPLSERNQVTCYKDIIVSQRCTCSETEVGSYTYQQTVPCPDREIKCPGVLTECMHLLGSELVVERVDCDDDNQVGGGSLLTYKVSDPDYYHKMCCRDPSFTLPQCPTRRTTYKGDQPIEFGEAYWRDLYGQNARFVPVPPPGGICGEWIIRQKIASNNCCDGVPPLVWDTSVAPEVIAPNSAVVIGVTGGGKYPYRWTVDGLGFQFQNGGKSIETLGSQVRLSALVGACGTAIITVTDGCTKCEGNIRCTAGSWELIGSFRPFDYYLKLGIVRPKGDNMYGYATTDRSTMLSGRYLMSEQHDNPDPSSTAVMAVETGNLVADSDITGMMVTDPVVGVFTWKACVECYLVYPEGTPGNWWRPFLSLPRGVDRAFYLFEWRC